MRDEVKDWVIQVCGPALTLLRLPPDDGSDHARNTLVSMDFSGGLEETRMLGLGFMSDLLSPDLCRWSWFYVTRWNVKMRCWFAILRAV